MIWLPVFIAAVIGGMIGYLVGSVMERRLYRAALQGLTQELNALAADTQELWMACGELFVSNLQEQRDDNRPRHLH